MKPLSVIQFVPSLKPTGPVSVSLDLADSLRKLGCRVVFWYLDDLPGAVKEDAVKVHLFNLPKTDGFDVIHAHGLRPDLALYFNRKKVNIPVFNTIHTYIGQDLKMRYGPLKATLGSAIWKKAMSAHDAHVVLQNNMKSWYEKHWKLKDIRVIPNARNSFVAGPPNDLLIKQMDELASKYTLVCSAGEVIAIKGLESLLHALSCDETLAWVHFGEGELLLALKAQSEKLGLSKRVLFAGYVPQAFQYLKHADVFAMPSRVEGFPLALLEAVYAGVPCVISDLPALRAIWKEGEVLFCNPSDPAMLARFIRKAQAEKASLTKAALHQYNTHYSPGLVVQQYLQLIRELCNHEA